MTAEERKEFDRVIKEGTIQEKMQIVYLHELKKVEGIVYMTETQQKRLLDSIKKPEERQMYNSIIQVYNKVNPICSNIYGIYKFLQKIQDEIIRTVQNYDYSVRQADFCNQIIKYTDNRIIENIVHNELRGLLYGNVRFIYDDSINGFRVDIEDTKNILIANVKAFAENMAMAKGMIEAIIDYADKNGVVNYLPNELNSLIYNLKADMAPNELFKNEYKTRDKWFNMPTYEETEIDKSVYDYMLYFLNR